jgi:SAM-dependent methyltransferase
MRGRLACKCRVDQGVSIRDPAHPPGRSTQRLLQIVTYLIDKLGRSRDLRGAVLELGCGPKKERPGSIGVDIADWPGVDIVGDAGELLGSLPEGLVSEIHSAHMFEHLDSTNIVSACARALADGGVLSVVVPHFSNPYFYSDPTHRQSFGLYTFSYLAEESLFRRRVPRYSAIPSLELVDVRLIFKAARPFYLRYALGRGIEGLVNLNRWTQELYESHFVYLFPCYELQYRLIKCRAIVSPATVHT